MPVDDDDAPEPLAVEAGDEVAHQRHVGRQLGALTVPG